MEVVTVGRRVAHRARVRVQRRPSRRFVIAAASVLGSLALLGTAAFVAAGAAAASTTGARHGGGFGGGFGGLRGSIALIGTGSLTLTETNGLSVVVGTTSSTTYRLGDTTISASSLVVGENVVARLAPGSTTSPVATEIDVVPAHVAGTVVSVTGTSIVVQDAQGFWWTVVVGGSTTYSSGRGGMAGTSVTVADVVPGVRIDAAGMVDANHTSLDATSVKIELAVLYGTVQSVSGTTVTLTAQPGGSTVSVTTTPSTTVRNRAGTVALSSLTAGQQLIALGTATSTSSFAAQFVYVASPHDWHFAGHGPLGGGRHGGGAGHR